MNKHFTQICFRCLALLLCPSWKVKANSRMQCKPQIEMLQIGHTIIETDLKFSVLHINASVTKLQVYIDQLRYWVDFKQTMLE